MDINLKVNYCSRKAALYAVERWHYSKCLPACDLVTIGVWENDIYIGCVIFGRGACSHLHEPYNLLPNEVVELTRVALNDHHIEVTKIIKMSLQLLKKKCSLLKLVVSYADQNQNHLGIMYQAGNWIYTGIGKSTPFYYYKGRWMHQRQFGGLKGVDLKNSMINGTKVKRKKVKNKYRYIMPLDKKTRKKVKHLSIPYPKKCPSGVTVAHPASGCGGGGSIPSKGLKEI